MPGFPQGLTLHDVHTSQPAQDGTRYIFEH